MSAAIRNALVNLNRKLEKLESAVDVASKKKKSGQDDLFTQIAGSKEPSNANVVDAKQIASRLDSAIGKVERLLKEGRV